MKADDPILEKLIKAVEDNIANENFGVQDLADILAISKSTLLRTVKKHSSMSVNQFIREIRLEQAKNKLEESELSISEIAFQTGFSSPSYFIKCFKDKYGLSPGEHRQTPEKNDIRPLDIPKKRSLKKYLLILLIISAMIAVRYFFYFKNVNKETEFKSIAVLPFKNESLDSGNVYFINGMMQSILNNLQKIGDLRVISRTSVEKYRNVNMTLPEIAEELKVKYIVEGSGQKIGEEILLSVQLIEAKSDKQVWAEQYKRKWTNVFELQSSISRQIASNIEALVKPEEIDQIEKIPTENLEAYDFFLRAIEFLNGTEAYGLDSSLFYFQKAIALDDNFAQAYAYSGVAFYYKDMFKSDKSYLEDLNNYSDKAILLDPDLPESLIARGLYYMQTAKFERAVEYFEKVLEISPNSAWTHNFLSEIYHRYIPDTEKYLVHAMAAMQLDYSKVDSNDASISHLILANALSQSGMIEKAKIEIQKSLDYDPSNIFSLYLDIYLDLFMDDSIENSINRMHSVYLLDTNRVDVIKELGKLYYATKDYDKSYFYYKKLLEKKELYGLNLFQEEDLTIALVARHVGDTQMAKERHDLYSKYVNENENTYTNLQKALLYMYEGKENEALNAFDKFSKENNILYFVVKWIDQDELFEPIANNPRFKASMKKMRMNFEKTKARRIQMLKEKGLW
ncbi:helix-turn-helix domain-containing protein [Hyphobacterium sp. CCMP332]|nr:helix-turn-helix domain-containing protein [Hyphobacterium sp. CCMP332]